jgi:hypothetical protein
MKKIYVTAAPGLVVSRFESSTRYITDADTCEVPATGGEGVYYERLRLHGDIIVLTEDEARKRLPSTDAKSSKSDLKGGK